MIKKKKKKKESLLNQKLDMLQVKATDLFKLDHVLNQHFKQGQVVVLGIMLAIKISNYSCFQVKEMRTSCEPADNLDFNVKPRENCPSCKHASTLRRS